jgi:hypothetical protein
MELAKIVLNRAVEPSETAGVRRTDRHPRDTRGSQRTVHERDPGRGGAYGCESRLGGLAIIRERGRDQSTEQLVRLTSPSHPAIAGFVPLTLTSLSEVHS